MSIELENAKEFVDWLKNKTRMNSLANSAQKRLVKRGQVYWCDFGINIGSEMSKKTPRPAVIVQNHIGNSKSSNTIVVPVTHDKSILPCLVPIEPVKNINGLTILDGQVNTSNIICVSKARLGDYITTLSISQMKMVDESIAKSVDLMRYYSDIEKKFNKLVTYNSKVKQERNNAQDESEKLKGIINQIRELVSKIELKELDRKELEKLLTTYNLMI